MPSLAWLTENQPNSSTQISSPFFLQSYDTYPSVSLSSFSLVETRLRVVPHFSSGIVEPAKRERAWKLPHARKGDTRWGERKMTSPHRVSPFLAWGDFHAHSRLARSTIPEEKWGTTRSQGGDQLSFLVTQRLWSLDKTSPIHSHLRLLLSRVTYGSNTGRLPWNQGLTCTTSPLQTNWINTHLDSFLKRLVLSSISDIFSWMIKEQYLQNKILSLFH